ncbi:MAG: sulfatase-like hydrolase/transferase [Actinomycetota bacterium]
MSTEHPDGRRPYVVVIMTDEEREAPVYESAELGRWRQRTLVSWRWWDDHAVRFGRHYTGSLACVPSRPTLFTGQYPDVHGVTQTDGLGKMADDSRMRWLPSDEVPTLGHWFRAAGYDTHYDGKWHISHADLRDPESGETLATNDDDGVVDPDAVRTYLDADRLDPWGFSGWVGPEPHGGLLANAGARRDDLIADRVVAWLRDRADRRATGDPDALRPFLLVASFVNPHDIVLFPMWQRTGWPIEADADRDPPDVPPAPTALEDLASKPAVHTVYRDGYPSAYGYADPVRAIYDEGEQDERNLYLRLHAEVDRPLDRVRRAVTGDDEAPAASTDAVLVRTADHGELLGAHGGMHQKWYQLYEESVRIPFAIARIGEAATTGVRVDDMPTSHVDLIPTLLDVAGLDERDLAETLRSTHSEVHPLPGRSLGDVIADPSVADPTRSVYLQTRDDMLSGDSGASGLARVMGLVDDCPPELRIRAPIDVATNVEGIVTRLVDGGPLWKLVRTFDDPSLWPIPEREGPDGRTEPLADEWELYDLDADPIEATNLLAGPVDPDQPLAEIVVELRDRLLEARTERVPRRHRPWPYSSIDAAAGSQESG